jgi:hypothetical protein
MNINARIRFNDFHIQVLKENETNNKDLRKYFSEHQNIPQIFDDMNDNEVDEIFIALEDIYLGKGCFRSVCKQYLGNDKLLV